MNALYTNTLGQGRPLVLLHGWGMNSRIWESVLPALTQRSCVTCIDLPGHGNNHSLLMGSLENTVAKLAPHIPQDAIIMGWSLGGLIAQRLAHTLPDKVAGLILITSTPKFAADTHWAHGLSAEVLTGFAHNLQTDYQGTVKRFFALQFLGIKTDTRSITALRERIMVLPASMQALEAGLNILARTDFTQKPVTQPTLWMLGRLDKLIPASLADALPEMGYKHIALLRHAAHVPFVTHPELFMEHIAAFLDEH